MQPAELGEDGRQHVGSKPVRRGDTQRALELRLVAGEPALEGERFLLDALGMTKNRIALVGQHEAVGGPLEKRMAHGVLERAQPPPHCRLRLTELPGRGAESALARHCQEDSEIAPLRLGNPLPPNRFAWTLCSIFDFHAGWKWPSCGCRARSIAMMSTATMQAAVLEHHAAPF